MRTEYRDPETGWDVLREPIDNGTSFREVITDPETGEQHERETWPGDDLPDVSGWLASIVDHRRWAEERKLQEERWVRKRYPELTRGAELPEGPLGAIKLAFARMYSTWELALPDDAVAVRQAGEVPNERGWRIRSDSAGRMGKSI